ncbi:Ankyrin repeats (3 copies) [Popillia japonica]|uniref:Ankyrin repeats (3 copies) n=1 Tax=Popillia japonica TaxID=7064 RepID=A0AAW1N716_POPJA
MGFTTVTVEYKNIVKALFSKDMGKIKGLQANLKLKKDVQPFYIKARKVPHALLPKVDAELLRLETEGVLEKVNSSEYATEQALSDIRNKKRTLRVTAESYAISASTLCEKLRNQYPNPPGGQTVLSQNDENALVERIIQASEWGYLYRVRMDPKFKSYKLVRLAMKGNNLTVLWNRKSNGTVPEMIPNETETFHDHTLNREYYDLQYFFIDQNGEAVYDMGLDDPVPVIDVNAANNNLDSPLHTAVQNECKETIGLLLEYKTDINAVNKRRETPLHLAVELYTLGIAEMLLKEGADVNKVASRLSTPLCHAITSGRKTKNMVDLLLKFFADANLESPEGMTSLSMAALRGNVEVVELLLRNGTKVNQVNKHGISSLDLAVMCDQHSIVQILLNNQADVNFRDKDCSTPLYRAVEDVEMVEILLKNGAYLHCRNKFGFTPLIFC